MQAKLEKPKEMEEEIEEKTETDFGVIDEKMTVKESKEFELLEEALYECEYLGTAKKVSSQDGGEYLSHKWEEIETGTFIYENSSLTLSTKSKLFDIFKACGFKAEQGTNLNLKDLVGKVCMLHVIQEKDSKGIMRNRVKTHAPVKVKKPKEGPEAIL